MAMKRVNWVEESTGVKVDDPAAKRAVWVPADSYRELETHLRSTFKGRVFPAHVTMLKEALA